MPGRVLNTLDLFSGIGGIALGLERTGRFRTVAMCEINPFCRSVLRHHWPEVPIHDDIRTLDPEQFRGTRIDVIAGGFPCQPHSVAGKQKGDQDERHLWPEYARLVRAIRPRWVLAENVPGIRSTAADEVIGDLEAAGYQVWPTVVGADDVGAPHRRKRVWFIARRMADPEHDGWGPDEPGRGTDRGEAPNGASARGRAVVDPDSARCEADPDAAVRARSEFQEMGSFSGASRTGGGSRTELADSNGQRRAGKRGKHGYPGALAERSDVDGRGQQVRLGDATNVEPQESQSAHGIDEERAEKRGRELIDSGVGTAGRAGGGDNADRDGRDGPCPEGRSIRLPDLAADAEGGGWAGEGQRGSAEQPWARPDGPRWPARPGESQFWWEEPRLADPARDAERGQSETARAERVGTRLPGDAGGIDELADRDDEQRRDRAAEVGGPRRKLDDCVVAGLADTSDRRPRDWPGAEVENGPCEQTDGDAGQLPGGLEGRGDAEGSSQRPLGRAADGLPAGLVRRLRRHNREALKAYGNAVVPDVMEVIAMAVLALEDAEVFG